MRKKKNQTPTPETPAALVTPEPEEFTLEDILREFGGGTAVAAPPAEEEKEAPAAEETAAAAEETVTEAPAEEPAPEETPAEPPVSEDTVRLDNLAQAHAQTQPEKTPQAGEPAAEEEEKPDPFTAQWEPEYDQPMGEYVPPEPIRFRPRSRLAELKHQLVEGPEKRYYALTEQGTGRLQLLIFLNFLLVLLAVGSTVLYGFGMVAPNRQKLLIFVQVLVMLLSGLVGSYRLIGGAADLVLRRKFTLDTLMLITFAVCCADGVVCLLRQKMPCCAAFSLEMLMCQWGTYHRRVTEIGQMDTLRKATRLDGIVKMPDYYEGKSAFLRREGQVDEFMNHYRDGSRQEKTLRMYALIALLAAAAIGVTAGVLHGVELGIRAAAAALLAGVPASMFITLTRPAAVLEHRLHRLGTVLCGWNAVRELSGPAVYPVTDEDLFPAGEMKMNGVKFYGQRDPDEVVAYAAALIGGCGGALAPLFTQLLDSRNGRHYDPENLRYYDSGGIGGEVCGEPVLVGAQSFLYDMGVEMPEGTKVNQAVYVAVDGQLCGVFAISYGKTRSAAAGLTTLCAYRGLNPLLLAGDFMLSESFLIGKFGVNARRILFPSYEQRAALARTVPPEDLPALALVTEEGLASSAYAVTGARALRKAASAGTAVHLAGGILGLAMMLVLAVFGAEQLLTPVNLLLYELLWMIPGLLISQWTRSV